MRRRVLVIEDREDIRTLLAVLLAGEGYEVDMACDGPEGVRRAIQNPPAAIVLDLMMPGMHGYEVLQHLRATPNTQRVPVIVLSAKAYPSDQRKALEMGATSFLPKPFDGERLLNAVRGAIDNTVITFWGVRGSIATPGPDTVRYGGNTPCVSVEHDGTMLILDAGTGIRKLGVALQAAAMGKPLQINLLISHTHWDHIQGFPFFVPAFVPGNSIRVFGPRSPDKPLEKVLRGQMDHEYFPVALGDMAARIEVEEYRGQSLDIGPFHITCAYLNHPGVTLGYRIETPDLVVVYATDTEPYRHVLARNAPDERALEQHLEFGQQQDRELVDLARGADVYIADAQYTPDEYKAKTGWGHTCYLDAVEVAIAAGVKRLVLFSHDAMHDDAAVDRKVAHCRAVVEDRGVDLEVLGAMEGTPLLLPAAARTATAKTEAAG